MPIVSGAPAPAAPDEGAELYAAIAREVQGLSFGERMALAASLNRGDRWGSLGPAARRAFARVARQLRP